MFKSQSENIGILCRGSSLLGLSDIEKNFDKCFIVNDFKNEIYHFENIFKRKEIIHFVNRLSTIPLKKKTYREFNIKKVQMNIPFTLNDRVFLISYFRYLSFFLRVHTVPTKFFNEINFTNRNAYKKKFPNTGIFSIFFTCKYLNVKNIYIAGLDFYKSDYIFRTKYASPLDVQYGKFVELNLIDIFIKFIRSKNYINFYMRTNYNFSNKPDNLILI